MINIYSNEHHNIQPIRKNLHLQAIIFFLFLIPYLFAQQTEGQQIWQQYVPKWFPLFAVAAMIGFGITGIAFMLSRAFQLPQLETWARMELFEVVGSIFLVAIIFISLGVIDSLFVAVANKTPMNMSLEFTKSISKELMNRYLDTIQIGAAIGLLSGAPPQYLPTTQPTQGTSGASNNQQEISNRLLMVAIKSFKLNFYSFYAADVFNGHFNLVQSIALTSLGISLLSHALLDFVNDIAIPFVIPFGLFLSMFSFSRKMGRTLIAFGVGLYIFVPLSILIVQTMYNSAFKPDTSIPNIARPSGNNDVDSFSSSVIIMSVFEFTAQLVLLSIKIAMEGGSVLIPSCVTGSNALASICGIAQPACATVFTFICTLFGGIADVPASNDLVTKLSQIVPYLSIPMLMSILDVPADASIRSIGDTSLTLIATKAAFSITGLVSSLVFHLIPSNAIMMNWIMPLLNELGNTTTYLLSVYTLNIYAVLNQYLAIKLTNITLAYTPYLMQYAVPVLFIPIVLIFIVITGIRSISPAIGGEIQILGVSELI